MPAGFFVQKQTENLGARDREPCDRAGLTIELRRNEHCPCGVFPGKGVVMPVWMEILINVIGYGGFVAVATYHRSPATIPDR